MQDLNLQFISLAFFALNGLSFSAFMLFKSINEEVKEGFWLSGFVFLCSMYVVPYMFGYMNWYALDGYRELLFYVPFQQLFLLGPVFYGYTLNVLGVEDPYLKKNFYLHFLPALIYGVYSLVAYLADAWFLSEMYFYADGRDKDLLPWYQFTGLLSMISYALLSLKSYQSYRKRIVQQLSYADTVVYKWVQLFLICLISILLVRIVFIVLFPNFGSFGIKYWYYLLFSILIYFLTLNGFAHLVTAINIANLLPQELGTSSLPTELPEVEPLDKTLSNFEKEQLLKKVDALSVVFEKERLYQNAQLSLTDVASQMGWNLRETSMIINQGFNKNFNDFVNGYRVDAVKDKLAKGAFVQHTLLAIALECGFNSKSTFNRVFKRMTQQSPNEYLNSLQK